MDEVKLDADEANPKQLNVEYIKCPKCRGQMSLSVDTDGRFFWNCISPRKCNSVVNFDSVGNSDFEQTLKSTQRNIRATKKDSHKPEQILKDDSLVVMGMRELGGENKLKNWMALPKRSLHGLRPAEVIDSVKGYGKVMQLLRKINQ